MARGKEMLRNGKQVADDLEPYRRLIEIQKQVMDLSKKHEATRREFDALRERVARELTEAPRAKNGVPQRLRRSMSKLLKQLSRITTTEKPARILNHKHSAHAKSH
jgi:predicted  nucleic acid-binding Zn-ribbon protein